MTLFRNFVAASAASIALFAASSASAAVILIDDFTTFQRVQDLPGAGVNNSVLADPNVLGGSRFMSVSTSPDNGAPLSDAKSILTSSGNPTNILQFENGDGQLGVATVTYDAGGVGFNGGLGIDLTMGGLLDKFFFEVLTADLAGTIFTTTVTSVGGATSQFVENIDASFSPFTKFSDFVGTANFEEVTALSFTFDSGTVVSFDGSIGSISAVPLPASALLLLGGLGGLFGAGAINRRRRREA